MRGRDVLPLLQGDLRPEMVEALKRIKAQCKTGCITNNLPANAMGSTSGRSLYVAEVMVLFDHVIESAKIGLRKPDPRIYRMMVDALKVDPEKCVYLDDLGVNLKPAREMGMTTIKVASAPQALAELEAATGIAATLVESSLRGAKATKQSIFPRSEAWMLRFARNDGSALLRRRGNPFRERCRQRRADRASSTPRSVISPVTSRAGVTSKA